MYVQFYQYMQSEEYRQDLKQQIAVETVRNANIFLSNLYPLGAYWAELHITVSVETWLHGYK